MCGGVQPGLAALCSLEGVAQNAGAKYAPYDPLPGFGSKLDDTFRGQAPFPDFSSLVQMDPAFDLFMKSFTQNQKVEPCNLLPQFPQPACAPAVQQAVPQDGTKSAPATSDDSHGDAAHMFGGSHAGSDSGCLNSLHDVGKGSKAKRTPKQQMQNKQAQQRYRERRKQKFSEMEQAIDLLSQRLKDLEGVRAQNAFLLGKSNQLEEQLAEKAKQVELLKQHSKTDRGVEVAPSGGSDSDVREKYLRSVDALKSFIERERIPEMDLTGHRAPPDLVHHCQLLVEEVCSTCRSVMSMDKTFVLELLAAESSKSGAEHQHHFAKWQAIVHSLQLSNSQQLLLLQLRDGAMQKLRALYKQRHTLNVVLMQAAGSLQEDEEEFVEDEIQALAREGLVASAKHSLKVRQAFDNLKENMKQERMVLMELNFRVVNSVLSPFQAAIMFVKSYPSHCDTLSLVNAVAFEHGDGESHSSNDALDKAAVFTSANHAVANATQSDICNTFPFNFGGPTVAMDNALDEELMQLLQDDDIADDMGWADIIMSGVVPPA